MLRDFNRAGLLICRLRPLLALRDRLLALHDLPRRSHLRHKEPPRLLVHLLPRRQYIRNGHQGPRRRFEIDVCGQQPTQPSADLCIRNRRGRMYRHPDELLQ